MTVMSPSGVSWCVEDTSSAGDIVCSVLSAGSRMYSSTRLVDFPSQVYIHLVNYQKLGTLYTKYHIYIVHYRTKALLTRSI